jgi:hypothetical protein
MSGNGRPKPGSPGVGRLFAFRYGGRCYGNHRGQSVDSLAIDLFRRKLLGGGMWKH